MKKIKLAENIKKKLYKFTGYAIWLLIVLLGFSVARSLEISAQIKAEVAAEEAKVAKMQEDNRKLQAQILESQGGEFIERQIRDKLGLVKSGEAIVVLPDDETLRKLAPEEPTPAEVLPDPNYRRWLKLFL